MRKKVVTIVAVIGTAILLWMYRSCSAYTPPDNLNTTNADAEIYADGHLEKSGYLPKDSPALLKVGAILKEKKGEWKTSWVSFAPVILIRTETMKVVFQNARVIVNFKDSEGNFVQLISDLTQDEFIQVQKLVREEVRNKLPPSSEPSH